MKKRELRSNCPINYALELLGDKWSLLIIRDFVFEGKRFYKDFLNAEEGIATNVLSDRLKRLEQFEIIRSEVYEKQRTQKKYTLTEKGKALIPTLIELIRWSSNYKDCLNINPLFLEQLETNKDFMIANIKEKVGTTVFSAHHAEK